MSSAASCREQNSFCRRIHSLAWSAVSIRNDRCRRGVVVVSFDNQMPVSIYHLYIVKMLNHRLKILVESDECSAGEIAVPSSASSRHKVITCFETVFESVFQISPRFLVLKVNFFVDCFVGNIFFEVRCYDDFEEKVNSHGDRWDDCINLWSGYSWKDYGREMLNCCGYNIPSELEDYIDYERYGEVSSMTA